MSVELWAAEVEPRQTQSGVFLVDRGLTSAFLVGSEDEILEALSRIADLFNAKVEKRDPGPMDLEGLLIHIRDYNERLGAK